MEKRACFYQGRLKIFSTLRKMKFKGVRDEVICKPTCRKFDKGSKRYQYKYGKKMTGLPRFFVLKSRQLKLSIEENDLKFSG
jgi:hypothetical protein